MQKLRPSFAQASNMNIIPYIHLFDKQKQKEKPIFKGYCKDLRLYVNSLNHTVSVMKSNGINTVMEKSEDEQTIRYIIVIKKK